MGVDREEVNKMWQGRWEEGRTGWHKDQVNPHLEEFFSSFTGDVQGKRILVPMCGKSVDLKWLHDKGMSVVGNEFVEMPIKEFFTEHGMEYTVEESKVLPGCKIFRSGDRMTIYQCDIFKITPELFDGPIDFLYDRASLVAIEYDNKKNYADVIQSVLSPCAQGLMEVMGYDRAMHPGPPYSTTEDDVIGYYSDAFVVKKLSDRKPGELPDWYASKIPGLLDCDYRAFHIQRK